MASHHQPDPIADLIRERNLERAKLINLLSTARGLMLRASAYVDGTVKQARAGGVKDEDLEIVLTTQREIQEFLDAGIFGDKEVKS